MTQTFGLRIIASDGTTGGTGGGTDNPVVMDKVPSHTHGFNATSGGESADHSHSYSGVTGYMNQNASHGHGVNDPTHRHEAIVGINANGSGLAGGSGVLLETQTKYAGTGISINGTDTNHTHNFSGGTSGRNTGHTHAVTGTSDANGGAANWTPRYLDMILCRRVAA
jgi:hypothetical protein